MAAGRGVIDPGHRLQHHKVGVTAQGDPALGVVQTEVPRRVLGQQPRGPGEGDAADT